MPSAIWNEGTVLEGRIYLLERCQGPQKNVKERVVAVPTLISRQRGTKITEPNLPEALVTDEEQFQRFTRALLLIVVHQRHSHHGGPSNTYSVVVWM